MVLASTLLHLDQFLSILIVSSILVNLLYLEFLFEMLCAVIATQLILQLLSLAIYCLYSFIPLACFPREIGAGDSELPEILLVNLIKIYKIYFNGLKNCKVFVQKYCYIVIQIQIFILVVGLSGIFFPRSLFCFSFHKFYVFTFVLNPVENPSYPQDIVQYYNARSLLHASVLRLLYPVCFSYGCGGIDCLFRFRSYSYIKMKFC